MKVVLWHSARFCLTNKLRTQLGSATGTVQAFGLALEEHLSLLKSLNPKQEVTELSRHILRMRDLVKFVDLLMDHVVMASEGSHPEPSFHTKSFLNSGSLRALKEMSGLLIRSGKAVGLHRIVQKHGLQVRFVS